MTRKFLILLSVLSLSILPACGASQPDTESISAQTESIPEENKPSINGTKQSASNDTNIIDENSWDYIVANYPHVTYEQIKSGKYQRQYVILSVVIDNTESPDYGNWIECNAWYPYEHSYIKDNFIFFDDRLPNYSPQLLLPGDNIDICFFNLDSNSFGNDIIGFHKNKESIPLNSIYKSFKENCSPLDYEALLNNPDNFLSKAFVMSGEVLQTTIDENKQVKLLLSISENKYTQIFYEYKENDYGILNGDNLTIYGIFTSLYNNPSDTHKVIPNIIAEFIDNESVVNEENTIKSEMRKKALLNEPLLTAVNGYRFKNSVDDVKLVFEEIYLVSSWNDIQPHNDSFLVMKVRASSDTASDDGIYDFPDTIVGADGSKYESINYNFHYDYKDKTGNVIDIATEINLGYVRKDEEKPRAYNINFVPGGNGIRYLVFDIPKDVALNPNSYLIFFGTKREMYEKEAPAANIYFSDYVVSE